MVSEDRKDAQRRRDIGVRGSKEIRLNQEKRGSAKIPEGRKAVQMKNIIIGTAGILTTERQL